MAGENQSVMQCVEVEALLAEALDGTLQGPTLAAFEAHRDSCAACRAMVADAQAGMNFLQGLDDAEPPRNLVHNILAQTIGALPSEHAVPKPRGEGWLEKLKGRLAPDVRARRYAALRHVLRNGILLHHHVAGHCRLPLRRCASS